MLQAERRGAAHRRNGWRPTPGQLALIALTWAGAATFALVVALGTNIGRVVFDLTERHGVRSGDVLVGTAAFGGALLVTLLILSPSWWPTLRQVGLVAVTWAVAAGFVLSVAAVTDVGRIVVRLTENHGVHAGDILAGMVGAGVALLLTAWILLPRRAGGTDR